MKRFSIAAAALLLAAAGCGESPTGPALTEESSDILFAPRATFLVCPTQEERSVTGTIGIGGGSLHLDGHRFTLPPLAVLQPTTFTMTAPASEFVELVIHAEGRSSFQFLLPAEIAISYDRCTRDNFDPDDLHVWYINRLLGVLLENMGGEADEDARSVIFNSGHLSGFIIAN